MQFGSGLFLEWRQCCARSLDRDDAVCVASLSISRAFSGAFFCVWVGPNWPVRSIYIYFYFYFSSLSSFIAVFASCYVAFCEGVEIELDEGFLPVMTFCCAVLSRFGVDAHYCVANYASLCGAAFFTTCLYVNVMYV